jgi:1-deoxy-D-xylulose-5-phosphate synthase
MGTALAQACADARVATPVRVVGLPRAFLAAGGREQILDLAGTTARDVVALAVSGLTDLAEVPDLTGSTPAVDGLGSPLTGLGAEF